MQKLTIAVDCDDVIVPTASLIVDHYNKTYGTSVELKNLYSYDLKVWGVDDDATAVARVDEYLMSDEYQSALPFVEAIDALRTLSKQHDLHIITGRRDFLATATEKMLDQYFPDLFQSVQYTNFFSDKPRSKSEVCQALQVDLLIDDHLHHAKVVADCGIRVLLFGDYPWNTSSDLPALIERVKDWPAVVKLLTTS